MAARCALYIGALKICRESLSTPVATVLETFNGLLFRPILRIALQNFKFVALPVPEIIASGLRVANPQSWRREHRKRSGMVPFKRAFVTSYRPSIVTFHLSLRVSEILSLFCASTPLFPTPPLVSPISLCSPGIRWMAFGL